MKSNPGGKGLFFKKLNKYTKVTSTWVPSQAVYWYCRWPSIADHDTSAQTSGVGIYSKKPSLAHNTIYSCYKI